MGYQLRKADMARVVQLEPNLLAVLTATLESYPVALICAHRNKEEQDAAYAQGFSKKQWPEGMHNRLPSLAMDLAPMPLLYKAPATDFCYMAGHVMRAAHELGIQIRWGGDWNRNLTSGDESFKDWGHFELLTA